MPLVNAKCTNCGATLTIDNDKEVSICQYCNSTFFVEKAIENHNVTNNINANIVNIYGDNTSNHSDDFIIEAGKLISYKGRSADVIIPLEVFLIGRSAFKNSSIKSIKFHNNQLNIEESEVTPNIKAAFYECKNLKTLTIPGNIKSIPTLCFAGCENLEHVVIEEGVESIGTSSFMYCESLKTISLPNSLSQIGNSAFSCCKSLEYIKIPKNVKVIKNRTFDSCTSLSKIIFENGIESIESLAFVGCKNLKTIHFPESMIKVDKQALLSCDNLEFITSDNPNLPTNNIKRNYQRNEGCYIATSIYGSYDCPEVWTLRRYRDTTLSKSWYGRLFILIYYSVSPILVKNFSETKFFRNLFKPKLDWIVRKLNNSGVSNKPYND